MRADDDGFVGNPKKILRMVGGNDDDLKMLIAKRFVLIFNSGVIVIKHWRINNLIRKDWYRETVYLEEKNSLAIKDNGSYTENANLVNENATKPPRRLGKVRLGKDNKRERLSPLKNSIKYLQEIPQEDVIDFTVNYVITEIEVKKKAEELFNYCKMHGKLYKDYKAFLRNAIAKDYKQRVILTETPLSDMIPD